MARTEFTRKTKQEALKRSRDVICHNCHMPFDRGYAICASRSAKPQFCSTDCKVADRKKKALENLSDRFWGRVCKKGIDDCWEWQGRKNERGYGMFDHGNKPRLASRFSYSLTKGHIDDNLFVCHSCDNPGCVNPNHLWLGTHQQNMDDAAAKKRMRGGHIRGSAVNTSRLSADKVLEIRSSTDTGSSLAAKFSVSKTAIYKIRRGENWGGLNGAN